MGSIAIQYCSILFTPATRAITVRTLWPMTRAKPPRSVAARECTQFDISDWRSRGNHLNGYKPLGQAPHVMLSHPTLDQVGAQIVIVCNLRNHSTRLLTALDDARLELGREPALLQSEPLGHHHSGDWGLYQFPCRSLSGITTSSTRRVYRSFTLHPGAWRINPMQRTQVQRDQALETKDFETDLDREIHRSVRSGIGNGCI